MDRRGKATIGLAVFVCVAALFVLVRVTIAKPDEKPKRTPIPAGEYDPAAWGKFYPLEYASYQKNREMAASPTGFGGSLKAQHALKEPEILVNFKGNPFSKDYGEDRGHPYAIEDLRESKRINEKSPGACMTCKTANLIDVWKNKGWGYAKAPLVELLPQLKHPITCANCHDPATMNLRIINPAFSEAMQRKGVDIGKASRDEMRSYVCAQCHVEYYFEPGTSRVIFPWDKGLHPEQIYAYYSQKPGGFEQDWIHPDSGSRLLKAQHPDYETFAGGVHAKSGVSCADCHMPYMRQAGQKYTSHWVTSPMRHTEQSCGPCHNQPAGWFLERVKTIQNNVWQLQRAAGMTLARAHEALGKAAAVPKANQAELEKSRELVRKAQWYWDFVAAENSMGFHNPDQVLNVLGQSIDLGHQAVETAGKAAKGN